MSQDCVPRSLGNAGDGVAGLGQALGGKRSNDPVYNRILPKPISNLPRQNLYCRVGDRM